MYWISGEYRSISAKIGRSNSFKVIRGWKASSAKRGTPGSASNKHDLKDELENFMDGPDRDLGGIDPSCNAHENPSGPKLTVEILMVPERRQSILVRLIVVRDCKTTLSKPGTPTSAYTSIDKRTKVEKTYQSSQQCDRHQNVSRKAACPSLPQPVFQRVGQASSWIDHSVGACSLEV